MMRLAELYPGRRFVGMDLSVEAITFAYSEPARRGLANIAFLAADVSVRVNTEMKTDLGEVNC
jgi:hypothetical protein